MTTDGIIYKLIRAQADEKANDHIRRMTLNRNYEFMIKLAREQLRQIYYRKLTYEQLVAPHEFDDRATMI